MLSLIHISTAAEKKRQKAHQQMDKVLQFIFQHFPWKGKQYWVCLLYTSCEHVSIPVGAIGGLNKDNCDILQGIDIDGICVVSAIMKQTDCESAAEELKEKIKTILK